MTHIYISGGGHVGLVSAVCYAQKRNFVSLYEEDTARRESIARSKSPFFEPKLNELLGRAIESERLEVIEEPIAAAARSEICIVAVGTPRRKDGSVYLSQVLQSCRNIAEAIKESAEYRVVAVRSTVFPGTTSGTVRHTIENVSGKRAGREFGLVAYPEFLREGSAIHDMLHPDRIILGQFDERSGDQLEGFVREFYGSDLPSVLRASPAAAEMIKYASNAFLATKIAFINEIANLCERFENVDVRQVADGMGYDHRIGREYLNAGLGFGGSCLPKDIRALVEGAKKEGVRLRIPEAVLASNELQPLRVIRLARELIGSLKGKRAAVLGIAFKPGTSDIREASSEKVVRALLCAGMRVTIYDPAATGDATRIFGKRVRYAETIRDCLAAADCCFIVTEWDDFRMIPSELFIEMMAQPVVIDGRRVLDPSKLDPRITYRAIGLGKR